MYISLFTVEISINYTNEFWELFEAVMYIEPKKSPKQYYGAV